MSDEEADAVSSCLVWGLCGSSYAPIPWILSPHALAENQLRLVYRTDNAGESDCLRIREHFGDHRSIAHGHRPFGFGSDVHR